MSCAGLVEAGSARSRGWRVDRQPGQAGAAPGAADARAAHPPREGDLQCLHGAGAAGGDRRVLCDLPRPGGTAPHRAAHASAGGGAGGGPARGRPAGELLVFSTRSRCDGVDAGTVHAAARARSINLRDLGPGAVGISLDETVERRRRRRRCGRCSASRRISTRWTRPRRMRIPAGIAAALADPDASGVSARTTRKPRCCATCGELADRDLALDRTMIPLGSCTMKLNATSEMIPISWPQFADAASLRAGRPERRATAP